MVEAATRPEMPWSVGTYCSRSRRDHHDRLTLRIDPARYWIRFRPGTSRQSLLEEAQATGVYFVLFEAIEAPFIHAQKYSNDADRFRPSSGSNSAAPSSVQNRFC